MNKIHSEVQRIIKDELLFIFKELYENDKITKEEYNKAVKIILKQYNN